MVEWSDGYVTHINYTSGFYEGLSPHAQSFALLYRGFVPPELAEGFTYCELGCGHGFTTSLLAAANPHGAFWGIDFNPTHIASAEGLKRAAGVANVTFLERSFAEARSADLPPLDFISMHGVWSWISLENRRVIIDFINAKLKPGGVVYISYNAMPGWAAAAPLRQLLVERLRAQGEPTAASIEEALSFATRMRDGKAGYFLLNEHSGKRLDTMSTLPRNYLVHEYLNRHWSASYHSEIVTELSAAKLVFAAPSVLAQQMEQLMLLPQARELLGEVKDPVARETVRDYFANTQFRRDLYVRGPRELSELERHDRLLDTYLVQMRPRPPFPFKVKVPVGEVTIEENPARAVFDCLANGPRRLGDILGDPQVGATGGGNNAFQVIAILLAGGALAPALGPEREADRRASAARFNRAMLAQPGAERREQTLVAPVLGTGLPVPLLDQVFLLHATADQPAPPELLAQDIVKRNLTIAPESSGSGSGTLDNLEIKLAEFSRERLPIYRQLGVI